MQSQKGIWVALIAVAIIAVASLCIVLSRGSASGSPSLGGVTNYDEIDATALKIGGSAGSRLGPIIAGSCSIIATSYTFAASSTQAVDCAVTGVVTGDLVEGWFATSSSNGAGWLVTQSSASTTAGFITLNIVNNTGASALIPASIASTTKYVVLHPRSSVPGL